MLLNPLTLALGYACLISAQRRYDGRSANPTFHRWPIGDARLTKVVEMESIGLGNLLLPDAKPRHVRRLLGLPPEHADQSGHIRLSIHSYVLELNGERILLDTCVGNGKRRQLPIWNRLATPFLQDLARAGFPPESIDLVVCTHLHIDHVGWNTVLRNEKWVPTFPNARYVFVQSEYEYWCQQRAKDRSRDTLFGDSVDPVVEAGLVDFVKPDASIRPGLSFIATPGHTPGHASVLLEQQGERALISGDFLHHPCQVLRPAWNCVFDVDPRMAADTRRSTLEHLADTRTYLFGTAFVEPSAGLIERAPGNDFRFVPITSEQQP